LQRCMQELPPARQPGHHRAHRKVQRLGNLFVRKLLKVKEDHRQLVTFVQLLNRFVQGKNIGIQRTVGAGKLVRVFERSFGRVPLFPQHMQRSQVEVRHTFWTSWFLMPLAASILCIGTLSYSPIRQEQLLGKDLVALLSEPPALQIISGDRSELLRWSTRVLPGSDIFPAQLDKVEFRGASAVSVADHKAVFLKMKNEQRASLLIVDARLTNQTGIKSMHEKTGSAALWSDQKRTYVLLFDGSMQEMHAYMDRMGIDA